MMLVTVRRPSRSSWTMSRIAFLNGDVPDIGRLRAGQFYIGTEGTSFVKAATPMCLSYHPEDPLTEEEVVIRARQGTRRSPDGRQPRRD